MKKIGRPNKINNVIVQKLETAFRDCASVTEACFLSGISRSTYYSYLKSDEEFSDKMTIAQSWISMIAKSNITKAIEAGDIPTSKWWLERKARDEFGANALSQEQLIAQQDNLDASEKTFETMREIGDNMKLMIEEDNEARRLSEATS